ncbi:MAG: lactonase family protein [Verrucomicrobiae bacterium]|nr:lactonase family protein [Verrucomicrobiae bacterium]
MKMGFLAGFVCLLVATVASSGESRLYVGTYTRVEGSRGIYRVDFEGGKLGEPVLAGEMENPSFVALSKSGKHLYAVSEVGGADGGRVVSWRVRESGALEKLNERATGGNGPCHLSLSPDGDTLVVANYGGGSVASFRVEGDGSLSERISFHQHQGSSVDPKRQKEPHAHSVNFSPDGRFVYAADLGTDRIYRYQTAADGTISPAGETRVDSGSGPRHFTFRPDGSFAYVINELTRTITAFRASDDGSLDSFQTISTLPDEAAPAGSTAEVLAHPSGRFLYGSNRGHDTIAVFRIDPEQGTLIRVENESVRGKTPRGFVLSPDGKWLLAAGQQSGTIAAFSIDPGTGALDFTGSEIRVDSPVCLRFQPN